MRSISLLLVGCLGVLGCGSTSKTISPDGGVGGGGGAGHDGGGGSGGAGGASAGHGGGTASGGSGGAGVGAFVQVFSPQSRDIDVLFMIDNSLSMQALIAKMTASFPAFTQTLQQSPGGVPNLHIAVVSSDLGAGTWTGIPQCAVGGDGGSFHSDIGAGTTEPGGMFCVNTGLNPNQHFISNVNGIANYDTTIGLDKVFACIASLGDHGCGFEHQIGSVVRALNADGQGLPANNAGFLRTDARLAIILLTNEDDCSAPPDTDLYDTNSKSISDPFGPLASYRCNEFGHLCNGVPPPRTTAATFNVGECVPAEGAGRLIPVATFVQQLKSLKANPSKIRMLAIAGPPDPYSVILSAAQTGTSDAAAGRMWPSVDHSCAVDSGDFADPGVRIKALVDAFGANGLFFPACASTYTPAMQIIGQIVAGGDLLCLEDVPPGVVNVQTPNVPATCTLNTDSGGVPACPAPSGIACFEFVSDATCHATGMKLQINPNGAASPAGDLTLRCLNPAGG